MILTQLCRTCDKEIPAGRKKYCDEHPSEKATSQRIKTEKRLEAGQCKSCNAPICPESTVFCAEHLKANRERGVKDRQRRKKLGLCRSCNEPISANSNTWCELHHVKQNELSRQLAEKTRLNQLCVDCNDNPRMIRKRRCEDCQDKYMAIKQSTCRRADCDSPAELKYFCRPHADEENEKLQQRRQRMKEENICIFCFDPITASDASHTLCANCRSKQRNQKRPVTVATV